MGKKLKDEVTIKRKKFSEILTETIMGEAKVEGLDGEMKLLSSLMTMKIGFEL
jgi:hypothetical protein